MAIDRLSLYQLAITRRAEGAKPAASVKSTTALTTASAAVPVASTALSLSTGSMPVDVERVAQIRQAVESGAYPLVPAKIADAMIAAGMLLSAPKDD
ncbi:flagellar biosynthesis anti-sigma factor FlgM [Novosphingobium sp. 9U]|uniref:flagellar biosynthesis anti-sigma factor FlgM n=1 Tax=Novosphingobium sp. 9U TaxID=2653158 RepID=UPI00135BDA2F|nr:flagellar biosynthesis anti-sigma factor FlgM [Novosphingobium sp. 9U]